MNAKKDILEKYDESIKKFHLFKIDDVKKTSEYYLLIKEYFQIYEGKQNSPYHKYDNNPKYKYKSNKIYKSIFFLKSIFQGKYLLIFLTLISLLTLSKEIQLRKIALSSEITITINGLGEQRILSNDSVGKNDIYFHFNYDPSAIYINGILQSSTGRTVNILSGETNNITLKWNADLIDCNVMFRGLSNITLVDLSKLDSSKVEGMLCMFQDCKSLTSIYFGNIDTSKVTDMSYMFYNCESLTSIDLSNFNTASAIDINSMFFGCKNIKSIDLTSFNTPNLRFTGSMFYDCEKLEHIKLTTLNTSKVEYMDRMFYGCSSLAEIDISNFDTSSVKGMNFMFYGCKLLESIDINNFDTSSVVDMSSMFEGCKSLKTLNLSNFNTTAVTNMASMFSGCEDLTSLYISNFDTSSVESMKYMFSECKLLNSLDISKFNAQSVTDLSFMFYNCKSLTSIDLSSFNTPNLQYLGSMFYNCEKLNNVKINNLSTSKVTAMDKMFFGCSSLTEIDISNFDTTSVIDIGCMFFECISLTSIDLSNFNTPNLKYMGSLFYNCGALRHAEVNSLNTSSVECMDWMFFGCSSLTKLNLSNFVTSSAYNMGHLFEKCSSLTSLDISKFETSRVNNMELMFSSCSSLSSLDLSNFITSSVTNMQEMFSDCSSLISLDLNNFITAQVNNMENIFYNCSSLIALNLLNFDTSNLNFMNDMFAYCNESLIYCINTDQLKEEISSQLENFPNNDCSDICFTDYHKIVLEERKCIAVCNLSNYKYEYNDLCYEACPKGTHISHNNSYICIDLINNSFPNNTNGSDSSDYDYDTNNNNYINSDSTEYMHSTAEEYYSHNLYNETKENFPDKCKSYSNESLIYNLCLVCNNDNNYYSKYNEYFKNTGFIECYNMEPQGYYLNTINSTYMPCFTRLNSNDKCEECYSNFNYLKCFEKCNYNNDRCIAKDRVYINNELNLGNINNNLDIKIYSYEITSEIDDLKRLYKNSTLIGISSEIKTVLINEFNLDENKDKIYVLIVDYEGNDSNIVTNDYIYKFFLENGTELNLCNIKEDYYIDIYAPLTDLELANFNYSQYFAKQGYDIYDKNSNFYNDICSPAYITGNDITLSDRKKDIYPNNATLCKDNCYYDGINREEQVIKCKCNLNINYTNTNDDDFLNDDDSNFITYFLDKINYKIFKCNKLLLDFDNLKSNFAFYTILGIFFLITLFNIVFYAFEIPKVKNLLINKENVSIKKKQNKKESNNSLSSEKRTTTKSKANPVKKKQNKNNKIGKNNTESNIKNNRKNLKKNKGNSNNNKLKKNAKRNKRHQHKHKRKKTSTKACFINTDFNGSKESGYNKVESEEEKVDLKEELNDLNELPYTQALSKDKRNVFIIFTSLLLQKIEFINLFYGGEKIKIILICQYILSLLINFFFNTLLYSDEIVSNKYHNNGKLDFFVTIVISLLSNVITSIFLYFISFSKEIEELLEELFKVKINNNYYVINNINKFFSVLKIKMFIFFIKEVIVIAICFYYIVIFCIIYSYSRKSLLFNYFSSLVEGLITSLIIAIIITIIRKIGLSYTNKYFYNASKYLNDKF